MHALIFGVIAWVSAYLIPIEPSSTNSWELNEKQLSQIPASSKEEKELILFLEQHWLAKVTGISSFLVDWVCPCFGVDVQVNPETTHCYTRLPLSGISKTYEKRVEMWKKSLPQPAYFPLILTRPHDCTGYIPHYFKINQGETIQFFCEKMALNMPKDGSKVVIDVTELFAKDFKNPKDWVQVWQLYEIQFMNACHKYNINRSQILVIQILKQESIGGIRLLPFSNCSSKEILENHQCLLEWISSFGLSANRIELDRLPAKETLSQSNQAQKGEFFKVPNILEGNWKSQHPQKSLMLQGTFQVLKGFIHSILENKWDEVMNCKTRSAIAKLSFSNIEKTLKQIENSDDQLSFFDTMICIEQIHANFSALLEIFNLFTKSDFSTIYKNQLGYIPVDIKKFVSCGIHSSAMTSLAGALKASKQFADQEILVIYGENTYFEVVKAAKSVSRAIPRGNATAKDLREADLMCLQFNPVWRPADSEFSQYNQENIFENLHQALDLRDAKPLTILLDCTIDFIDSPQIRDFLIEFKGDIISGLLNIICYRSGVKFDLLGMDNYCGAPFFMIHNDDEKWRAFDILLTDAALQADNLSCNWFCLAYQNASFELDQYRKQIFDNTRKLLNKIPSSLLQRENSNYKVIEIDKRANPAFIDIRIFGPLHSIKAAALFGGGLFISSMKKQQPMFFRPGFGFYHSNFTMLFFKEFTTIRLTLGLDPSQIDTLVNSLERLVES